MNSSNKHIYNKNQTIVEHGSSKTFFMNEGSSKAPTDKELDDRRESKRREMINFILTYNAADLAEDFFFDTNPHSGIIWDEEEDSFKWNHKALEEDDDLALAYKVDACKRFKLK